MCLKVSVWEGILATWGHFATVTYDGNERRRELAMEAVENGSAEVTIVAYPTFQDKDKFATLNNGRVKWKAVIIDELHFCKNLKAEVAKNLRKFRDTHKCVIIGLTGRFCNVMMIQKAGKCPV
jgi:SNF2 family DNA or RNA helicase